MPKLRAKRLKRRTVSSVLGAKKSKALFGGATKKQRQHYLSAKGTLFRRKKKEKKQESQDITEKNEFLGFAQLAEMKKKLKKKD